MHIQHVIAFPETRRVARSVWLLKEVIKADIHSLFVVTDHKGKCWLQEEIKHMRQFRGKNYVPTDKPDCSILHSLSREHIRDLDDATLCIQQEGDLSPAWGVRTIAYSRFCADKIGADDFVYTCGYSNPDRENREPVIGIIVNDPVHASGEEGLIVQTLAKLLPRVRFVAPFGTEDFRAMAGPDTGARTLYNHTTEALSGICDICIFTHHDDPMGDLVANAILSKSVPIVCSNGAQKEYVPSHELVYSTYHQAIKICCRLVREQGLLDRMKRQCADFYGAKLSLPQFRSNIGRQLSKVVANAGAHTWT